MARRPTELAPLRMLVAVHEEGSITGAAELLMLSQQGVSARMRALESHWGITLFERSTRGTRLTADGVLIAQWARELITASQAFESALGSLRREGPSSIKVAASLTVAEHLFPGWLGAYVADGGHTRIELSAVNSERVVDMVRSGTHALGFIETSDVPPDLSGAQIGHDALVVVVGARHAWASRETVSLDELAATPLISRERGSGTRRTLEQHLRSAGDLALAEPAAELDTTLAIRSTVMAGAGVAVLSGLAVAEDIAAGRLVRVATEGPALSRPLTALWRGEAPTDAPARDLLAIARR